MVGTFEARSNLVICAVFALACVGMLLGSAPVAAHPADEILEQDMVHFRPTGIAVDLTISAGTIKLLKVWQDADTNGDKRLDTTELDVFGRFLAEGYTIAVDGTTVPTTYLMGSLAMKQTYQDFELQGADPTGAVVTASFAAPLPAGNARHEITIAVNHYNGFSNDRPPEFYPDASDGIAVAVQGGNDVDLRVTTSPASASAAAPSAPAAPRNPNTTPVTGLERLVREPTGGPLFIAAGLVIALVLGALHALTPGHGKTLMAAYLVGSRGTPMRACALGGIITLTHTGSVIALGIATVLLAGTVVPERIIIWTELVSGLAIVALGVALLRARMRSAQMVTGIARRRSAHQTLALAGPPGARMSSSDARSPLLHEHEDGTVHAHGWFGEHGHTHAPPQETSWKSLLVMGMGGGIIPCPDALAILLVAMAAGHIVLGIAIVLGFSVGLAAVLIALGLLLTTTRLLDRATNRWRWLDRAGPWLPVVSAVVIIVLGLVAFARAAPALR